MTQIDPSLGQSESCLLRPHVHRTRIAARRSYGALIALCMAQCAVRRCLIIRKTSGSALYAFDCAPPPPTAAEAVEDPGAHLWHMVDRALGAAVPRGQAAHGSTPPTPAAPGKHVGWQADMPSPDVDVPGGHVAHTDAPSPLVDPLAHLSHSANPPPNTAYMQRMNTEIAARMTQRTWFVYVCACCTCMRLCL